MGPQTPCLKMRLSLVELLFRLAEERARQLSRAAPDAIPIVARAVDELNSRFRQARMWDCTITTGSCSLRETS